MAARKAQTRPTIALIAERVGVSPGAVSYALNGRPGVSDETRARILEVAREVGWVPSTAARALRGGGAATVGLVITREPQMLGIEPFFMSFIAGIEQVISEQGFALLLQVTPDPARETATYREWWSARRVDGIFLTDLTVDDPRLAILEDIGLPAVVVGDPAYAGGLTAVGSDDAGAAEQAVARLAQLGHRRIAHVAGPERFVHTLRRSEAMRAAGGRLGVEIVAEIHTDYTFDDGARACGALLNLERRPTAMVFDNDLTALGALRAARTRGVDVPRDLSLLAWDDSPLCSLTEPPLSALSRDVAAYGAEAARALLATVKGHDGALASSISIATLVDRGSLGPAPHDVVADAAS
ncbi:HTH-type transcriptional repressor CytR [Demequina sediminis]|uniref:HTH-type transcriptional repressor CytR n=1 Tax=Demequina sediminis TaxID=1930058 RepID=A0ABP9WFV7_9MICO|nr:LacI family DNA-binding transcriptional regulator [Demequina sediminis]BDZ60992.1 LacI family transcriptional regulator [Demequina sediminis]